MIRALLALLFALGASACVALPVRANTCTVPNSLTNGQVVDANVLNTNFVSLQSCGNNIDSTNIGPAGILASQIIATSAVNGVFGGTAGFSFSAKNAGMTPLTINGVSGQTADMFDVVATSGGLKVAFVDSAGYFHALNSYIGGTGAQVGIGTGFLASGIPTINNSSDGGINFGLYSGSTLGYRFFLGTTPTLLFTIAPSGVVTAASTIIAPNATFSGPVVSSSNSSTLAYVPPVYNLTGTVTAQTEHTVRSIVAGTMTAACNTQSKCPFTGSATFGAAAIFASSSSYECNFTIADDQADYPGLLFSGARASGSLVNFEVFNGYSGTYASGTVVYANMICHGS